MAKKKYGPNVIDDLKNLSMYLKGVASMSSDIEFADNMKLASKWIGELSESICVGQIIGCGGGYECTSDHK